MSRPGDSPALSKADFAEAFGMSPKQLERFFAQGMPYFKRGKHVFVPMPAGQVWYHAYLIEKGRRQGTPKDIDEARQRKTSAEAELAELELARRRGETVLVEEYEARLGAAYANVRAKLLNLAARAAGAAIGAATLEECVARINPLVDEILGEL